MTFEDAPYISPSLFLPYLSSINNDHLLPLQHSAVLSLALTLTVTLALTWRLQSQPTPYKDNVPLDAWKGSLTPLDAWKGSLIPLDV